MVAKRVGIAVGFIISLNLAKIHMVAKLSIDDTKDVDSLNLAKIHMVAKQV